MKAQQPSLARAIPLLLLACTACTAIAPPPQPATPENASSPPPVHGLTVEEEAVILSMEDRRAYEAPVVQSWVTHANPLHRARIALALGRIGPHTFIDANQNQEKDQGEQQAGVSELIALSADSDPNVRLHTAFGLGEIGDAAGVDTLFRLTGDADARVAAEAVEALSKMTAVVPLERYGALVSRGPEGVQAQATRYLFRFNSDEASKLAAAALESSSSALRQEGAYALSRRAYAPARERLELIAGDASTLTRAYAIAALGRIGAAESIPLLVRSLGDIHPWVRTNAAVALGRAAANHPQAINLEDVPRILAAVEDPDPGMRAMTIDPLGYYAARNETARRKLMEIAANGSRWERELAAAALVKHLGERHAPQTATNWAKVRMLEAAPQMRSSFHNDEDRMVLARAIDAIPDTSVDAEMKMIRRGLAHEDPIVRANALEKYAQSKEEPAATRRQALTEAEQRARADQENDARIAAIRALATIESPERDGFLRSLLADKDVVVRRLAADLIEQELKMNRPQYTPLDTGRTAEDYQRIVAWSRQPHTATIHLTRGLIEIALLAQEAPLTAWNFAELAKRKYFDNTSFMRVVPNFVIQGGDPRNDQSGGPGYAIRDEINLQKYTRGAVGMALSGPDTGGSQFFITHSPQPHLDGGYTIFGRVYSGMNGVVDQTERGDRVETITIDEKASAPATEISSVQQVPLPLVVGPATLAQLLAVLPDYAERQAAYQPDGTVVEMIADAIQPEDRMEVFMGTWCHDSQREVPRLLRINDQLRERGKALPVSFVAVDKSKAQPAALIAGKNIEKVATFIYYRGSRELGRIVERPAAVFEDDLLAIATRP